MSGVWAAIDSGRHSAKVGQRMWARTARGCSCQARGGRGGVQSAAASGLRKLTSRAQVVASGHEPGIKRMMLGRVRRYRLSDQVQAASSAGRSKSC